MVEANPEMIPVIRKNFLLNEMSSPLIIQAAVAEKDGELSFGINRNFWSSSTIRRAGERRVTVPAKSIPTLIASMEQRPTALIMDIEGGEARIPLDHLLLFDKIVMETHRKLVGNEPIDRILRQLAGNGFKEIARIGGSIAFRRS